MWRAPITNRRVFDGHVAWVNEKGEVWPDYYAQLDENKAKRGRTLFPARPDGSRGNGSYCARLLRDALEKRKIPLLFSHRATRLVKNQKSEVIGIEATDGSGRTVAIRARNPCLLMRLRLRGRYVGFMALSDY